MIKDYIHKIKWSDCGFFKNLLNIFYFNLIRKNRFIIYKFDLTQHFSLPSPNDPNRKIKFVNFKELQAYLLESGDLPREFYMHKIDGVNYCVIVLINDRIGHISWIYMEGEKNRWFDLGKGEAQLNYCFTFPEFRGKGLFPQALLESARWLNDRGYKRIFMEVHDETIFMTNSLKKVPEMKKIGSLTHWCFYRPKFKHK